MMQVMIALLFAFIACLSGRIVYEIIYWILRCRFGIEFGEDITVPEIITGAIMLSVAMAIFLLLVRYFG